MKPKLITLRLFVAALMTLAIQAGFAADKKQKPLRALLITGGCCHNYIFQSQALIDGVAKHAKVNWTVINEGGKGTKAMIPLYKNPNWAKNYKTAMCFGYQKGECVHGDKCKYAHGE